ncbi:DUF305 domain-containing protein [Trichocoleus sp. FACHB-262]|uniref:DUF305 domain-containing protein n=1 Tax=Trichocoleus sp. FACHB-262 TaxID=2692869 RepID=UPI001682E81B|nr:DUF305 domain-containing protein [Trichocoleus sp. FACHB-262]MBD2124294.1 DUF305 domain-containing protein [Trichocoleus sp. FACHB-262]
MQPPTSRAKAPARLLTAIAFTGSLLISCASTPETQAPTPGATRSSAANPSASLQAQGMNHAHPGSSHNTALDLGPSEANYDLRFIDAMIPHHQGAIAMAKAAQQKAQRPELKQLAAEMIQAQTQEITQLQKWRQQWYPEFDSTPMAYDAEKRKMLPMSAQQQAAMMMHQDFSASGNEFDQRFLSAMMPHHAGAIAMAQDALQKSQHLEIKQLAQNILTTQKAEIQKMQQWQAAWSQP